MADTGRLGVEDREGLPTEGLTQPPHRPTEAGIECM
jgi:hypothetical protein